MMHECPKCGFVQPQDQYCANCGLDIDNYKPAPTTLLQKLGKNTVLQLSILVAVVLALTTYVFLKQREAIEKHFAISPQSIEELVSMTDTNSEEPVVTEAAEASVEPDSFEDDESTTTPTEDATATATPPVAGVSAKDKKEKLDLVITFAEASNTTLQQLASEGQILNETAQRRSFINSNIDSINKLKERDTEFRILAGGSSHHLAITNPISFDFMHISGATNDDVGLNLEITPVSITDTHVEINLTGQLFLKAENGSTIASQEINANYIFPNKSTLLMVGFLPRQAVRQEDLHGFSNTPLAILESLQFINGLTDFVIFIQVK